MHPAPMAYRFRNYGGDGLTPTSAALTAGEADAGALVSDGMDGECELDGVNQVPFATLAGNVYTAVRIPFPNNLKIKDGYILDLAGFEGPFARGVIEIEADGGSGGGILRQLTNDASGGTGGIAKTAIVLSATLAGGNGTTGVGGAGGASGQTQWPNTDKWVSGAGGLGSGGAGAGAGAASVAATGMGSKRGRVAMLTGKSIQSAAVANFTYGAGGGGGGGNGAAVGGGGGGGGWQIRMGAARIINYGQILCRGGNGGAGAAANCGGGGGGGGGDVEIVCGSYYGVEPDVRGGHGGASGGGTGVIGKPGLEGAYNIHELGKPHIGHQVTLTASERAAAIVGGILDLSGTCYLSGSPSSGAPGTNASGSGSFYVFKGSSSDGELSIWYDAANNAMKLKVRGAVVLTASLAANPAAPTMQTWRHGDKLDWRIWYDPAGGSRSVGLRLAVNNSFGNDSWGTGSGSALAALTTAYAMGTSATRWQATSSLLAGVKTADIAARGVILGDSIMAPRLTECSVGSLLGNLGVSGGIASLAQSGATANQQLATWQASRHRGDASVQWVAIQIGTNDLVAGDSAGTLLSDIQAIVNDIATNNPAAKIIVCKVPPAAEYFLPAQQLVWLDVNIGIAGGGGTPITGAHAIVVDNVTNLADPQNCLHHGKADHLHPTNLGRLKIARPIYTALSGLSLL